MASCSGETGQGASALRGSIPLGSNWWMDLLSEMRAFSFTMIGCWVATAASLLLPILVCDRQAHKNTSRVVLTIDFQYRVGISLVEEEIKQKD